MYELYKNNIYNEFIKEQRKKRKLTIADLSRKIPYSPASLSLVENSHNILCNDKLSYLLKEYGYEEDFLFQFDQEISLLFLKFINNIIYVNKEVTEQSFNTLKNYLAPYKTSVLYTSYYLAEFIYLRHTQNFSNKKTVEFLKLNMKFFTEKYQSLFYMYCVSYEIYNKNIFEATNYFERTTTLLIANNTFEDMYHYFTASYFIWVNDIPRSIYHCEKAISLFTKSQNYKRLSSTNIIVANQYLKLKQYSKSYNLNLSVFENSIKNNDLFNKRVALNNMGFIHMMKNQFDEAVLCFEKMPKEYMRESHYYSYMICLGEIGDIDNCRKICLDGKKISVTPYYQYMFKIYEKYTEDKNIKRLSSKIEKVFEKYDDYLDIFEREFLCTLLGNQYKKMGNIKKALEYFEKLNELSYSN